MNPGLQTHTVKYNSNLPFGIKTLPVLMVSHWLTSLESHAVKVFLDLGIFFKLYYILGGFFKEKPICIGSMKLIY